MRSLRVAILATDPEQQRYIRTACDESGLARVVHCSAAFPRSIDDPAFHDLRDLKLEVILVDVPAKAQTGMDTVEFLHGQLPETLLVPIGDTKPQVIVSLMRAGAGEFLERPVTGDALRDAFSRQIRQLEKRTDVRGKVVCFVNGKGGSGATTAAVNTALALCAQNGPVIILELAPPGGACLHLNVTPRFTLADAFRNFHRLDFALMEGFMADCGNGLALLAGSEDPLEPAASEDLARLLDVLASQFRFIIIDASSRVDELTRRCCDFADQVLLVAQPEVGSLWAAAKVRKYISGNAPDKRVGLLLNRYRRMPGLESEHIEAAVGCKVFATIQNQYVSISRSIENGAPVAREGRSELGSVFSRIAALLAGEKGIPTVAETKARGKVFDKLATTRTFSFSGNS
ncbi:MAG: AAA family ATPase [Acidobacteria bacterium]|nr:AAA family ATPase [Acidobacteriaceae bacterium]MBV9608937.1 AAA family ATPase [Acidobacteriota bacterium]